MSNIKIIAEAGVNHNGDLDRAFALVDAAAAAGADIVKFQSFRADKLASKNAPKAEYQIANADAGAAESQYDMLKRLELSEGDHEALIAHCKTKNIEFLSTPFDIDSLRMLVDDFGLETIKLGSSELTNAPILLAAARTQKPVIFSTGMGTLEEVEEALGALAFGYLHDGAPQTRSDFKAALDNPKAQAILKEKVTILHCTTEYPTPYGDVNLRAMRTMYDKFGVATGYSDHTMGIEVSLAAAALGATVIEKHFTLDRNLPGPDHKASLEPDELIALVRGIRNIEASMGDGTKTPAESEKKNMIVARKSLVTLRDIKKGETLTEENITIKRPGNGRSPMEYWDALGTPADQDYNKDDLLR